MKGNKTTQMMLDGLKDDLRFSRTGPFYKLKVPFTKPRLTTLLGKVAFPQINQVAARLSGLGAPYLQQIRSSTLGPWGAEVEAFGTLHIQPVLVPAKLVTSGVELNELRFAHVLILEGRSTSKGDAGQWYGFVNREILSDPLSENASAMPLSRGELLNPFLQSTQPGGEAARIEEINMRMMNVSRVGLRRKLLEAFDVEASVSSLGLHRTIPGTMRVRLPRKSAVGTAVTLSPARHAVRVGSGRVKLSTLTEWFAQCVRLLAKGNNQHQLNNAFLSQMAEPLESLDGLEPSSVMLDISALKDAELGEGTTWERGKETPVAWSSEESVRAAFDEPIPLKQDIRKATPKGVRVYVGSVDAEPGRPVEIGVEVEGDTCRLAALKGSALGTISVGLEDPVPYEQWINHANALRIPFDGGRVLYVAEGAYRSGNLRLAVQHLLGRMVGVASLGKVKSEKGAVNSNDESFPPDSCFHFIESDALITKPSSIVVCGDAIDEMFDYLEISPSEKRIRWLHAKVEGKKGEHQRLTMSEGKDSLSASNLQEVVGQAIKNLAFLRRDPADATFLKAVSTWTGNCTLPVASKIPRLRRGLSPDGALRKIIEDAAAIQEVAIVVPAYSKESLTTEFGLIEKGKAKQHIIQLFWLLSGFANACLEVGVTPLVILRK